MFPEDRDESPVCTTSLSCHLTLILFLTLLMSSFGTSAQAQKAGGVGNDASSANDPSAPLTQVQLQNWYHPLYAGIPGQGNEFLLRPIVPAGSRGVFPSSLARLEITLMSTPDGRTGLGDLQFIDFLFPGYHEGGKLKMGIGPVIVAPSATDRYAGQGQWQAGPAAIVIYTKIPKLILGAIEDNPITVTGERSRPGVDAMTLEPLIVKELPRNYFLRFDPYWVFDWKQHGSATIPLNLALGRLIKIHGQLINTYIEPEFLARRPPYPGNNPPRFTLRLAVHLLYPKNS